MKATSIQNSFYYLGLRGVRITSMGENSGSLEIWVKKDVDIGICPECGILSSKVNDTRSHTVVDRPILNHKVKIIVEKRRFKCLNDDCSRKTFTEEIEGLGRGCFYTDLFREFIYGLTKAMTYMDTKRYLDRNYQLEVGLTTIYTNSRKRLQAETPPLAPQEVRYIGLDEFSKGKGHDYGVAVTDLEARKIIDIGAGGKTKKAAKELLRNNLKLNGVLACVIDMWKPFRDACEILPNASVIVDKFHVIKKTNEALNRVSNRVCRSTADDTFKEQLSKYRELLRMGRERLTSGQQRRLKEILHFDSQLCKVYEFKELLRDIYNARDQSKAQAQLENWIREATLTFIPELMELSETLENWKKEILHYWRFRLTNAVTEGKLNKIKTLQRKAYHYNNFKNLRLKILEAER
ncbi:MAG: ISL3 family transposase [bacterium]